MDPSGKEPTPHDTKLRSSFMSLKPSLLLVLLTIAASGAYAGGLAPQWEGTTPPGKSPPAPLPSEVDVFMSEPGSPQPSEQDIRLSEVGAVIYEKRELENGEYTNLIGVDAGNLNKSIISKKDKKATQELAKFLAKNEALLGKAKDYEFKIVSVNQRMESTKVKFHQLIDGVPLPESRLTILNETTVDTFQIVTANPSDAVFDKASWISEKDLLEIARTALDTEFGRPVEEEPESSGFKGVFHKDIEAITVVFEVQFSGRLIQINAISGEVHLIANLTAAYRMCEKKPAATYGSYKDCGNSNMEVFNNNGTCQGGSSNCTDLDYNDAKFEVQDAYLWSADGGYRLSGPASYDLMFDVYNPDASPIVDTVGWARKNQSGLYAIGFGPSWKSASNTIQSDVAVHEYGHTIHIAHNITAYNAHQDEFGLAVGESIGDVFAAYETGDTTISLPQSFGSREVDNNRKWSDWNTLNGYHQKSQIISEFFWEVKKALESPLGERIFFDFVEDHSSATAGNLGVFDIYDVRGFVRNFIYNVGVGLTSSQRSSICSIWTSRNFPGSPCKTPDKPDWITSHIYPNCGTTWDPDQQAYISGSQYYFKWDDVNREDNFWICDSENPFSGYSCFTWTSRNDTNSLPWSFVVASPTWYVAVMACNESGCSSLMGMPITNYCN